jgi:hypothetical protein
MNELLIFYLTNNDRYFVFDKFKNEINKSKYKDKFKFLIINSNTDSSYFENKLKDTNIDYDIVHVDCPQSNYLPKVKFAIEYAKLNNYKYILKYDSDVLMPKYTLDFIFENLNKLDDKNNLTIGPSVSTGIPSVEFFIDDFFCEKDAKEIRKEFKRCVFQVQPGIMDYTYLNKCSVDNQDEWNGDYYYNSLNSHMDNILTDENGRTPNGYCKFYRGIHPIRHGFGNDLLNDLIIKNKEKFFLDKTCSLSENNSCKQLVAMCFVILTENYDKIINSENLTIDGCDEVPINRFAWNNNLKHLIVRNGYAIHIIYNWRWFLNEIDGGSNINKPNISLQEYEENFIKKLYSDDTN